jgi:formiminotetrahydrofolate cyclodeaminase
MSEIKENSIQIFLNQLASSSATPGGGSVAALMGAQSAALISMVCNLTIGKAKYTEVELEMKALLHQTEDLREKLTALIKADVDVFTHLMNAYGMTKQTDDEIRVRSEAIQNVLKAATEVPLECARLCSELIALSSHAANKGYDGVISDAGAAVMAAYSGLKSSALNVYINTSSLKDQDFAQAKLIELEAIMKGADIAAEEIYQTVKNRL